MQIMSSWDRQEFLSLILHHPFRVSRWSDYNKHNCVRGYWVVILYRQQLMLVIHKPHFIQSLFCRKINFRRGRFLNIFSKARYIAFMNYIAVTLVPIFMPGPLVQANQLPVVIKSYVTQVSSGIRRYMAIMQKV